MKKKLIINIWADTFHQRDNNTSWIINTGRVFMDFSYESIHEIRGVLKLPITMCERGS